MCRGGAVSLTEAQDMKNRTPVINMSNRANSLFIKIHKDKKGHPL